ncbi:hypothetical protein HispidOSU_024110, partial [Sigmodon hispidus]
MSHWTHKQRSFYWTSCNLQRSTREERKPRGGARGRLFAEKAGAAACGATRSVTALAREYPVRRPRAATAGGFLALQNTLRCQQERLGLMGERLRSPRCPMQS